MTLGLSTKVLRDYSLREAIEIAHTYGYREIEFWVDDLLNTDLSVEEIIRLTDTYGIGRSVHLLTEDLNLASFNEPIRQEAVRQEMEGLKLTARLGARAATLHPGRKTAKTRKPEEAWKQQLRSIDELAQCAQDCGVTLDFCYFATNGIFARELDQLRLPVKNVHISQCVVGKPHYALDKEGQIDFANILAMLCQVGYTGSVTMEIKSVYDCQVYSASRAVLNSLNLN